MVTFGAKSLALAWCTDRSVPTSSSWTRTLAYGAVRALVFREAQARGAEAPDSGSACSLCLGRPGAHRGRGGVPASRVFRCLPPFSPSFLSGLFLPPPRFVPKAIEGHRDLQACSLHPPFTRPFTHPGELPTLGALASAGPGCGEGRGDGGPTGWGEAHPWTLVIAPLVVLAEHP